MNSVDQYTDRHRIRINRVVFFVVQFQLLEALPPLLTLPYQLLPVGPVRVPLRDPYHLRKEMATRRRPRLSLDLALGLGLDLGPWPLRLHWPQLA